MEKIGSSAQLADFITLCPLSGVSGLIQSNYCLPLKDLWIQIVWMGVITAIVRVAHGSMERALDPSHDKNASPPRAVDSGSGKD